MRLGILASGFGSNLQAILDAIGESRLDATVAVVISDKANAQALVRATQAGCEALHVSPKDHATKQEFDNAVQQLLDDRNIDVVVLAGFMRILSAAFVQHFTGRLVNIHPSLLPAYPGLNTHQRALTAKDTEHGCTIHYVNETVDAGPIIMQAILKIHPEDTEESLQQRVHTLEHLAYPQVLQWMAEKRLKLCDDGVYFDNKVLPPHGLRYHA